MALVSLMMRFDISLAIAPIQKRIGNPGVILSIQPFNVHSLSLANAIITLIREHVHLALIAKMQRVSDVYL